MNNYFNVLSLFLLLILVSCQKEAPVVESTLRAPDSIEPETILVKNLELSTVRMTDFPTPQTNSLPTGSSAPQRVSLARLQDDQGEIVRDPSGNSFILGQGGISQFKKYTSEEGLALDAINCALLDSRGHLWFGTNGGGASRFDGLSFTTFSDAQGLVENSVRSIFEDRDGNIWFGTVGGISKFDGKVFTNYSAEEIGDGVIFAISQDSQGNMWFGTSAVGAVRFDGKEFEVVGADQGLNEYLVVHILEDAEGNLWFATYGGGLTQMVDGKFKTFTTKDGLSSDRVRNIYEDRRGDLWISTIGGGVSHFDGETFTNYGLEDGLASLVVRSAIEDRDGNLWFATERGASKFEGGKFTSYTTDQGLAGNNVMGSVLDKGQNLWFLTDGGGVSRLDGTHFTNFTNNQGLAGNIILSIEEDQNGDLWFGTSGFGVSRFDGESFTTINTAHGLAGDIVFCMMEDDQDRLWFGTGGNGISIFDGKKFSQISQENGLVSNEIYALLQDRKGGIWIGTDTGLHYLHDGQLDYFSSEEALTGDVILSLYEDQTGAIWIGAVDGGITRFDGEKFQRITTSQGIVDNGIIRISGDLEGNLWIGTAHGVSFLSQSQVLDLSQNQSGILKFQNFTTQEGLSNNLIQQIVPLPDGKIALGSNLGITVFKPEAKSDHEISLAEIENFNADNGYPVKDLTDGQNGMFLDSKGVLWAGTGSSKTGLVRFDYAHYIPVKPQQDLMIKQIRINEEVIPWHTLAGEDSSSFGEKAFADVFTQASDELITLGRKLSPLERQNLRERFQGISFESVDGFFPVPQKLKLPYRHNHLNIEYGSNEMARPFLIEYQYILEGYDLEWSPVLQRTSATFGNIQEGDYTFLVKSRYSGTSESNAGEWTEPISFEFSVLPPWYRSWWAYGIYGLLALSLIYPINIYLRNRVLKAEREKAKERELQHAKEIEKAYQELASTHENLKSTQSQLIQAEKMASLGELTAGIAHEIQNPLNFVKNFAEVSQELMEEMEEEIQKGDYEEVTFIAKDIRENLGRISQHSLRADGIVKAMLQHSRTSAGEKEPTDINALAEECLHLSFHGIRAKEKDFNSDFKTELDPEIPKLNVIPQEIGRILLNMLNNAFYAVNQKAHHAEQTDYKPLVLLKTKKVIGGLEVTIEDNGTGIPETIVGKIFQPFFTTKPTGQGTGLGLSLSYDIVKSYGGDLRVKSNTQEPSGTAFTIYLPTQPE
ncbi:two-component regulator propeller domain-containing protein [Algoriphagus sp.]|uniref:two-component regulator propeller domain-containing protein n=1 Tax=Algoriphagus sp. TaxID=1872435 RepID=UPI00262EEE58|nr:two-component regulator propeller domain-containing protein [Algoriphagus sp.]